ncbi:MULTISPECIES: hypothetical protein [unclassified Saccharicrinis]|uniref:hypothetical protein n=1 Tax=unclassified Saccharicrinis TaxID=2646859 RepID=UPI003D349700
MKTIYVTLLILIFTPIISYGQGESRSVYNSMSFFDFNNKVRYSKMINGEQNALYSGSPYITKSFRRGSLTMEDGSTFTDLLLRYNNYKDIMEIKIDSGEFELSKSFPINSVTINGFKYKRKQWMKDNVIREGFFVVLSDKNVGLYQKKVVVLQEAKVAKAYQEAKLPSFREKKVRYYANNTKSNILIEVSNKKRLLSLFSDKQTEIKKYMKENKVKANNPKDLTKILNYYNSLVN